MSGNTEDDDLTGLLVWRSVLKIHNNLHGVVFASGEDRTATSG